MSNIIACIDGSTYADSVCAYSAWVAERSGLAVSLLHVVAPHSDMADTSDLSGQIGLGAKSELLAQLAKMDEERGKLEQKKGQLMLEHAKEELLAKGINQLELLHRRGSLVETVAELEAQAEIIIMGKRGEHAVNAPEHLGSNLERVARAIHKPLLVVTENPQPVSRFLIAYDGSASAQKAMDYVCGSSLLAGAECHVLTVGNATVDAQDKLKRSEEQLVEAGFAVSTAIQQGQSVEAVIVDYIQANAIDLLAMGAYGHSKIRSFILGSTTTALIRDSNIPVLLFR